MIILAKQKSDWLLKATVSALSIQECNQKFEHLNLPQINQGLLSTQLCAFDQLKNSDACQGIKNFIQLKKLITINQLIIN